MKRKPIVVANWKMNIMPSQAFHLAAEMKHLMMNSKVEIVVAPPYTHLALLIPLRDSNFSIGAQNVHYAVSGAYTSGISAGMLVDLNVDFVILGHSERREAYPDEAGVLCDKIEACHRNDLTVIYCCGETQEVRQSGNEFDFVRHQLEFDFRKILEWKDSQTIIAYEPIWAIGTGLTASAEQADEMHDLIRKWLASKYGSTASERTRIIYGGSVKSSNADELASKKNIDGALVGGASLNAHEFANIAKAWDEEYSKY